MQPGQQVHEPTRCAMPACLRSAGKKKPFSGSEDFSPVHSLSFPAAFSSKVLWWLGLCTKDYAEMFDFTQQPSDGEDGSGLT